MSPLGGRAGKGPRYGLTLGEASLVERRVGDRPIATYYSLGEKRRARCPVFDSLELWAEAWLDEDE